MQEEDKLTLFEVFGCLHVERRGQGSRTGRYGSSRRLIARAMRS